MKAYKGFNKDMTCRGFQYEEGKEYETDKAICCQSGFHACEAPLDCFRYYPPANSEYHEVEIDDVTDERYSDDTKICGKKIKIGAKISIAKLCRLQFEFVKLNCTNENNVFNEGAATAGYRGAATAGDSGAATAGDSGAATSRGKSSVGRNGVSVARGNNVKAKGDIGSVIVIVNECEDTCDIAEWKVGVIDGKILKADTWYALRNGEFVEAEE